MTAEIRNDVIVATEHIKAPPEVVFPYFTDPALIVTWIGDRAELDPRPDQVKTTRIWMQNAATLARDLDRRRAVAVTADTERVFARDLHQVGGLPQQIGDLFVLQPESSLQL